MFDSQIGYSVFGSTCTSKCFKAGSLIDPLYTGFPDLTGRKFWHFENRIIKLI